MEEELKLTTKLDVQALNLGHIPSINYIEMLAENNKKLQRLTEEREQCMFSMKEEIVELLDDLEMDLNATSLDILLITDDQKFDSLRQCDLDSVRNTLEDLREQVVKREAEVKEMVEQVVALYERLDVSPEDQCPLSSGRVCGLNELGKSENLEQVKKELKRMISLRAVNMRQIMEKSEAELVVLWNDCMVGPNVRKQFLDSALEDPDKELERLDVAIKEMQDYKERNRNILKDLQKFLDRCNLAKELQLRLLDPNRLFKSRGNAMAKEEADRKLVNTLPALKEELLELARTREDLIVNDVTMSQLIEDNCRLLEQIYESSLSRTTVSHNKTKTNSVKSNSSLRSLNSPRSTKRVGRLLTSPGLRRPLTRANSTLMSVSGRMTGSTKTLGTRTKRQNESPLSRPGKTLVQSSTMPRLHGRNPKILVSDASCNMQDASTIDESAFKENVPSNSTLISSSHLSSPPGLGAVRELSFEQERLRLAMAELKVHQQKTLAMSKREPKDFSQMEASLKSKVSYINCNEMICD